MASQDKDIANTFLQFHLLCLTNYRYIFSLEVQFNCDCRSNCRKEKNKYYCAHCCFCCC